MKFSPENFKEMLTLTFILIIVTFFVTNAYEKNLELSIDRISWSDYIIHFKGIGIDSYSFRNFKENLVSILKHNNDHLNIFGISPFLHLSKKQFEINFKENSQIIPHSFSYEPSIFNDLFHGIKNGEYYNWKDKNMIVISDSYNSKPNSWIYTLKSAIESFYLIRYDFNIDIDIVNIQECSVNPSIYSFLEYSSMNSILLSSYKRKSSGCLNDESHSINKIDEIKIVRSNSIYSGPLIVEIDLNFDSIRYYQSSTNFHSGKILLLESINKNPNYSALIVGFGRDVNTNYLIIQTFFGDNWGNKGTFKLDVNSNAIKNIYTI